MSKNKKKLSYVPAVVVLMILYMTYLVGLITPHQQKWFLFYTPYFLLTHILFLLIYHKNWSKATTGFILGSIVVGFLVEAVAVQTGVLFGPYSFGGSLGIALMRVPVVMGLYWFMLSYSAACLAGKIPFKNFFAQIVMGAALMVGLTGLIQQVAAPLDFWYLNTDRFIQYYSVIFIVGLGLQVLFHKLKLDNKNPMSIYVYGGLIIFFTGLVMFLHP